MKTEFTVFQADGFAAIYNRMKDDRSLMTVLADMQTQQGIPARKAFQNAEALITLVAENENLKDQLSEDAPQVISTFLKDSAKLKGYDRKLLLHQLYFGLKLYQDADLVSKLQDGVSEQKLFHDYYVNLDQNNGMTEDQLEADILHMISTYHLSAAAMQVYARMLKRSNNLMATSAVLGEHGQRFQCITAMSIYLNNRDGLTLEEAVNQACTHPQLEAMADAAAMGQIIDERMQKLLMVLAVAFLLTTIVLRLSNGSLVSAMNSLATDTVRDAVGTIFSSDSYILATEGVRSEVNRAIVQAVTEAGRPNTVIQHAKALKDLRSLTFLGFLGTGCCYDKVSDWMGRLTAKHCFLHYDHEALAAQAVEGMADRAARREAAANAPRKECTAPKTGKVTRTRKNLACIFA